MGIGVRAHGAQVAGSPSFPDIVSFGNDTVPFFFWGAAAGAAAAAGAEAAVGDTGR